MGNYLKDNFASKLKLFRKEKRLSLKGLADQINQKYGTSFNKSMLSKWENGRNTADLNSLKILSLFFNVNLNTLLGFNEVKNEEKNKKLLIPVIADFQYKKQGNLKEDICNYAPEPPLFGIEEDELKKYFYLKVSSESMDAEFQKGDLILIKNEDYEDGINKVALINNGHDIQIKKLRNNSLLLRNSEKSQSIKIKIIGTVISKTRIY